jgi:hypothetical protein
MRKRETEEGTALRARAMKPATFGFDSAFSSAGRSSYGTMSKPGARVVEGRTRERRWRAQKATRVDGFPPHAL